MIVAPGERRRRASAAACGPERGPLGQRGLGLLDLRLGRVEAARRPGPRADLVGLLVVHAAAHEHDLVERQHPSAAASAFSKTTISTSPSRSSSVANIMFAPLRGADLLGLGDHAADLHPLAVLALGDLGDRAVGLHLQRLAHALERVLGDEDADRLLLDRQQLGRSNSSRRDRRVRRARRTRPSRPSSPKPAEVEDRALADLRVLLGLLARRLRGSSTSSMPLRVAPVEPNAPHLISASIERLLTVRRPRARRSPTAT